MNQLYADRLGRVCGQLENKGLTQMIVSDPLSIWYLTGVRIEPYERLFALYIRTDGKHVFFLNNLFVIPETDIGKVWMSDRDDCIGIVAAHVDAGSDMGVDKSWPARFLLDRDGKIISANMTRPSDPKTAEKFNELLGL